MASSSRAKKQRTSMTHKKQGNKIYLHSVRNQMPIILKLFSKEEIEMHKQMALGETVKSRDILVHNLDINWDFTVMNHMWSVRETNSPMPYAIIISNILGHFGVSTAGESKITLNARDRKTNVDVIH
ncbi:hypothetical protein Lal_00024332 [Lupinus albus]|nr:hypothetical protein Lal_00024332 [Lupinus albus]